MKTSKQIEIDFWKKIIKRYIKINEQLQIINDGLKIIFFKISKFINKNTR